MTRWLKRIWSRIWGDVIIRKAKPTPSRDKLIYGHERNSLRDRFNRVRAGCGCPSTRDFSGGRRLDLTGSVSPEELDAYMEKMISNVKKVPYLDASGSCGDYNLRFSLADMTDCGWIPVRDAERSGSV